MEWRHVPVLLRSRSLVLVLLGIASQVLDPCMACADDLSPPVAVQTEDVVLLPTPAATAERFSSGFQSTYIWQKKPRMSAAYTLPDSNSLQQGAETGYTLSATLYLGARPWKHTEIFVNPEVIQTINISDLHGLGGMSNSENQKGGKQIPTLYMARAFVRQTISFGDESVAVDAGQNQFASTVGSRRLVLSAGLMPLIDVFDTNPYAHDGRTQFLNWALLAHGAFDFAADTRGYTWGIAAEYYHAAWALRLGRYLVPKESNGMAIDFNLFAHYGDNLEIEHRHSLHGREGRIRVLGFRNYERMGAFAEAVAGAAGNVPSMARVRRDQAKLGFGIAAEQAFHRDGGVFVHASWNDGRTETYSFAEIERSLAVGTTMKGPLWHRPGDSVGLAWVRSGLSSEHRNYLAAGGLGFLIGDGQLTRYKPEQILEAYYAIATFSGLWLSLDYQYIANPAYNADRGPAQFLGVRLHLEI